MTDCVLFVSRMFKALVYFLNNTVAFTLFDFKVSYFGIIVFGFVTTFVITAFWKGAKA